ncbi:MAG: glycosyltransferase family 39 protein [Acidobacteriota bacterium]|nr:glycosyltransferase family 39 protein [Acidobacteriota bacterium]
MRRVFLSPLVRSVLVFAGYFVLVLAMQWRAGALDAGFGAYPDEPAHFITGLMVHDYLKAGLPRHPVAFAVNFYSRLPQVGLGHWPPLFYLIEAIWMLLFGVSRASLLVLIALIAAALAWTVFSKAAKEFNFAAGVIAGLLISLFPILRWSDNIVLTDTMVALLGFLACVAWGRYLDAGRTADSLWYGLLAAAALFTKSSAGYVLLIPPIATLLAGRVAIFKKAATWLPVLIIGALYIPWWIFTWRLADTGLIGWLSADQTIARLAKLPGMITGMVGLPLAALVLIGAGATLAGVPRITGLWAVILVQPFAILETMLVAPVDIEPRHLIPLLPSMMLLACAGVRWIDSKLPAAVFGRESRVALALAVCGLVSVLVAAPSAYQGHADGARELVTAILQQPGDPVVLVARSEGRIIAEIALREPRRPGVLCIRAIKLLASADWYANQYSQRFTTPAAVMAAMEDVPVDIVVAHPAPSKDCSPHELAILQAVRMWPQRWQPLGAWPPATPEYAAWRLVGGETGRARRLPPQLLDKLRYELGPLYESQP